MQLQFHSLVMSPVNSLVRILLTTGIAFSSTAYSDTKASKPNEASDCEQLPSYAMLKQALASSRSQDNGGLNNEMWGALVSRGGHICSVAFTGAEVGDQWPGSRLIAIEKANTANALSSPKSALSTANIYYGAQPGGFLFGITTTNPVDASRAYQGSEKDFGSPTDPLIGASLGGVVVFGGGLALYDSGGKLIGGLGVSGDTSCADHNIAWRARSELKLDYVPGGVAKDKSDQIIYDIHLGKSMSGFGHPSCVGNEAKIAKKLPKIRSKTNS